MSCWYPKHNKPPKAMVQVNEMSAQDYWLSFCNDWFVLAQESYKAGQKDMGAFFDELSDDAGEVWSGLYGRIAA